MTPSLNKKKVDHRFLLVAICGWTSAVWAAPAPSPGLNPALAGQWLGGLVLVLALIFLCLWGLKKLNRWTSPAGGQMRLLGGVSLGGREKLLLVEVGEIQLILGVAPGRVPTLHVLEGQQRLQTEENAPFTGYLQQALHQAGGK